MVCVCNVLDLCYSDPIQSILNKKWITLVLILALIGCDFLIVMPEFMKLDDVFYYMVFFLEGYIMKDVWYVMKRYCKIYWYVTIPIFLFFNMIFVSHFTKVQFVFRFILPLTGFFACQSLAELLSSKETAIANFIAYCGKYSLQFYLFTFCYPIIRWGIVSVLQITNPVLIFLSVFILQLGTIIIIVEISRRIRFLKLLCGY